MSVLADLWPAPEAAVGFCASLLLVLALAAWPHAAPRWRRTATRWPRPPPARRTAVAIALGALFCWLAAGPRWPQPMAEPTRHAALVLIDDSCSMRYPAQAHPAQHDERLLRARLAQTEGADALAALGERLDVQIKRLSEAIEPAAKGCVGRSPLPEAVRALAAASPEPIARALLISDGRHTGENGASPKLAPSEPWPFAIDTLAIGEPLPDWAITRIDAPSFAFVKTQASIDVHVQSRHLPSGQTRVRLWQHSTLLAEQSVHLAPNEDKTVHFVVRFDARGPRTLLAQIEPHAQEKVRHNNERAFSLQILRDKIRVLHVVGEPSFDGRFVREALLRGRNVDLVSFYILRTPYSDASVPQNELSLIPFPVAQLFTTELKNFDVVVLQQFDPRAFGMQPYVAHLRQAVQQGLGLIVVGTPASVAQTGWLDSPLQPLLPLAPVHARAGPPLSRRGPLFLTTTPTARSFWRAPEGFGQAQAAGHAPVLHDALIDAGAPALSSGAVALLQTPSAAGAMAPVLAWRRAERGQVAMLLSDHSWRWAFDADDARAQAGGALLHTLWERLLGALTDDEGAGPWALEMAQPQGRSGQLLHGLVRPVGEQAADAAPLVTLQAQQMAGQWLGEGGPRPLSTPWPLSVGEEGAAFALRPAHAGRLLLSVAVNKASDAPMSRWVAIAPSEEEDGVQPDAEALARLSADSGGRVVQRVAQFAERAYAQPTAAGGKTVWAPRPLWPRRGVVLSAFGLLVAHWWWARRADFR